MNKNAEQHLVKARDYVARGAEFYRMAAKEMRAAKDEGATWTEIADAVEMSATWVKDIIAWKETPANRGRYTGDLPFAEDKGAVAKRHTRSVLRESTPDQLREIMDTLPVERRAEVVRAAVPPPERAPIARTGPSFIELLVRVNTALIELEAMVASWQNTAAVPAEFSRESFGDVVQKALRIQDKFDDLVAAIDNEDEDEFQKIVRNFKVTSDVG